MFFHFWAKASKFSPWEEGDEAGEDRGEDTAREVSEETGIHSPRFLRNLLFLLHILIFV